MMVRQEMPKSLQIDNAIDGNLKPLKDSDGTLTALEISTDKLRVKNLDVTGDINGGFTRQIHVINTGFYSSTSKVYIPLNGYIFERTATSSNNEYVAMPAPYNGRVIKVIARSEEVCGSTIVGFHKSSEGTEVPNTSATSDVTIDMAVDDTAYTFDFTGQDNTFTASNIIAFSFDPTNNCYDTNVVVVLEYEIGKI